MIVMKFGGTSMGSGERMEGAVEIIRDRAACSRLGLVVSAVGGVSNLLQESIDSAVTGSSPREFINSIRNIHYKILEDLEKGKSGFRNLSGKIKEELDGILSEYENLIMAVSTFKECPDSVYTRIMACGERLSSRIMYGLIKAENLSVCLLDSRDFIKTTGSLLEGEPVYSEIIKAFEPFKHGQDKVLLMSGFVASSLDNKTSLLGRNGSDFSAALMAMGLEAEKLEIWTDVDGIYTADPRIVPDARLVSQMTYEEAMELSFFGSKVLHPKTITPIAQKNIETWSLNSFNPSSPGTKIARGPFNDGNAIRGITSLKNVSLITVSGPGLKGRHGSAARIFSAVSSKGISVLLITQASSEYTITFCVKDSQSEITKNCIEDEFALEIRENLINPVEIKNGYAIITVVGDGMIKYKGIAATVFTALYSGDINIRAIAQGSSERSISTVINGKYADKAVRIIHRFFFDDFKTIDLFVFGIGNIGSRLLNQIREQKEDLETQKIKIKVMGIANSTHMLLDKNGIDLDAWQQKLKDSPTNASVEKVLDFIKEEKPLNPVFADCTKSEKLPELYSKILGRACHIATPNKIANIKSMDFYRNLRYAANRAGKGFFYETNVGAGLPVIDTVQNMRKSGDSLISFEGILSGSMSYIFGRLNEGILFSQSVKEAMDMGFTEPDPRDDLSGADAKNKVLIIAREWGYSLELDDIKVDSIYPDNFDLSGSKEDFLARLSDLDSFFNELVKKTASEDKFLAYTGEITPMGCRVGLKGLPKGHSLSGIAGGENAFVFKTRRYSPIPLVVRGYGAGGEVTAAGVFSDILKTLSWRNPISINL